MNQVSTEQMIAFRSKYVELYDQWLEAPDRSDEADNVVCEMHQLIEEELFGINYGN